MKLKQIIAREKEIMLPLNFFVSYILTPMYVGVTALVLAVFGILMCIDDEKYLFAGILCLGFLAVISVCMLAMIPYVNKEAIKTELDNFYFFYNFRQKIQFENPSWQFVAKDGTKFVFDRDGVVAGNISFPYEQTEFRIITDNYCKRVNIFIRAIVGDNEPIDLSLVQYLDMLEYCNMKVSNQATLEYILTNTEDAFKQIYTKGFVS